MATNGHQTVSLPARAPGAAPVEVRIAPPPSLADRLELEVARKKAPYRAMFAALGLCWDPHCKNRPKVPYRYDVLEYGGLVLQDLHARGFAIDGCTDAAVEAMRLAITTPFESAGAAEAQGFSEAGEGGSTS